MSGTVRFDFMHFMPYVHLPKNQKDYKSLWVDFPNKYYDPQKGHALYQRYLAELILADEVGFDAVVVNEHHNTSYSMMAAPNLIAAAIIPQIKNAKICVWGTPPNLEYPNRLAEEYAMLDVLSQGRLEVAFPLGTGMEYWANPINPATARERHRDRSTSFCKLGRRTAQPPITAISTPTVTSIRGRGLIRNRIHLAISSGREVRKRSISRPSLASVTRRCSSPSNGRSNSIRTCVGLQPSTAIKSDRSNFRSR